MRILSVSGASSRSGKTSLAVTVASCLQRGGFKAVKFTTAADHQTGCARGSPCTVCDINVDFRILTDPEILREEGTDTARLVSSGASEVIWCIARVSALQRAWHAVQASLSPEDTLMVEGSTILQAVQPDISFFVINPSVPPERWKDTSRDLIPASDFVCINIPSGKRLHGPVQEVLSATRRIRGKDDLLVVDVQQDLSLWPSREPLQRIRRLLATPP